MNATPFVTSRLATADVAAGTREGYVEIFNMADIGSGTANVYPTVKHTSSGGAPTCSTTVLEALETTYSAQLTAPSTGLMANWTIINVPNTTVFSGAATAVEANTATKVVYSRQTSNAVTATVASTAFPNIASTFDGVLLTTGFATAEYDFPDMSTPYETTMASAGAQIYNLSSTIAHTSLINEFILETGLSGKTDWLVSMPTRRYFVAGRGSAATGASAGAGTYAATVALLEGAAQTLVGTDLCTNETTAAYGSCTYAGNDTTTKSGAQGYYRGATTYAADGRSACVEIGGYGMYDRNEVTAQGSSVVVSPGTVTAVQLCGEVNILSLNNLTTNTAAVGANLTVAGLTVPYQSGWASVNLNKTGKLGGLPVIGFAFVKATNPAVSAGISGNFGGTWAHRWANGKF